MPKISSDPKKIKKVAEIARDVFGPESYILPLPKNSTEIFPGEKGKVIIYLYKKPERDISVINSIERAFKISYELKGITVTIFDSNEEEWITV